MKWQNKSLTNIITRRLKMWKLNDKIRDAQILSQENWKCKKSNAKIRDSRILSQEDWKYENQFTKEEIQEYYHKKIEYEKNQMTN